MRIVETAIKDVLLLYPTIWEDDRGHFFENYNQKTFSELGIKAHFVQDNQSFSHKGALRGLHFQSPPFAQGKLVRVIQGSVMDVVVDIRKDSATYGQHFDFVLSGKNNIQMWIPEGFAHGFLTLEDNTIFSYKCTAGYNKASEGGIIWNDSTINIDWAIDNPIISSKDKELPLLSEFKSPF